MQSGYVYVYCMGKIFECMYGSVFDPASKNPRNDADHFVIGDELEAAVHHDAMWKIYYYCGYGQQLPTAPHRRDE